MKILKNVIYLSLFSLIFFITGCNEKEKYNVSVLDLGTKTITTFEVTSGTDIEINRQPVSEIKGDKTMLNKPIDMLFSKYDNRLYVLNQRFTRNFFSQQYDNAVVYMYNKNSNGNQPPVDSIYVTEGREKLDPSSLSLLLKDTMIYLSYGASVSRNWDIFMRGYWIDLPTVNNRSGGFRHKKVMLGSPLADSVITRPADICFNFDSTMVVIAEPDSNRILFYSKPDTWNNHLVMPDKILSGPATLLERPVSIAYGYYGELYVLNLGSSSTGPYVTSYLANSSGNIAPLRRLGGPGTTNLQVLGPAPRAMELSRSKYKNALFLAGGNTLMIFDMQASGNDAPITTLHNPNFDIPVSIAIY